MAQWALRPFSVKMPERQECFGPYTTIVTLTLLAVSHIIFSWRNQSPDLFEFRGSLVPSVADDVVWSLCHRLPLNSSATCRPSCLQPMSTRQAVPAAAMRTALTSGTQRMYCCPAPRRGTRCINGTYDPADVQTLRSATLSSSRSA